MAAIAPTHEGVKDVRTGRSPYFWIIVDNPRGRMGRLREGLTTTARFILLGPTMHVIYQFTVFNPFYPVEALIAALLPGFVPWPSHTIRALAARQYAGWNPVTVPYYTWAMPERACRFAASRVRSV